MVEIDFPVVVPKIDAILSRGLSNGLGEEGGQVCIEAAICEALGLPHGDDPQCVSSAVRSYKIRLNDSNWSSPEARAAGLRNLGVAQLGSKGVVGDQEFVRRLAEKTIRVLLPKMFRECFPGKEWASQAADRCEQEGTFESALASANVSAYASASSAEAAAKAYTYVDAAAAAAAASAEFAASATRSHDEYLILSASLALETLQELNSPGCAWI